MHLALTEISQNIFQIRSQVVKSCFEVLCYKSVNHTFYSKARKQFLVCH